jgi:hypothetical protein
MKRIVHVDVKSSWFSNVFNFPYGPRCEQRGVFDRSLQVDERQTSISNLGDHFIINLDYGAIFGALNTDPTCSLVLVFNGGTTLHPCLLGSWVCDHNGTKGAPWTTAPELSRLHMSGCGTCRRTRSAYAGTNSEEGITGQKRPM